jgi:hypothetical protein
MHFWLYIGMSATVHMDTRSSATAPKNIYAHTTSQLTNMTFTSATVSYLLAYHVTFVTLWNPVKRLWEIIDIISAFIQNKHTYWLLVRYVASTRN